VANASVLLTVPAYSHHARRQDESRSKSLACVFILSSLETVSWVDSVRWVADSSESPIPGRLRIIDQTRLPNELFYIELHTIEEVYTAIKRLVVRGAPAIGIAGAFGLLLGLQNVADNFSEAACNRASYLISARPTAVNLAWSARATASIVDIPAGR